ncbi:hypothetical protein EZV62_023952 [Acer yangbiense]|uniref:SWIM-type domain-containing protein n=1 Tax=Acer yangbiense TaxID=1000413 RepID=A0A5C7H389_9ROSI|nr:hypothetical protein EZV62_023952 [Acer yangbiense]
MYTLYVNLNSQELELGSIDPDYFNLYMLWEATMGDAGKDFNPQHDKCITHAYLPWSGEMRLVESDSDLLEVFYQFGQHDTYIIHFDMEPLSLNGQPHTAPILQSSDDVDVFVEQERGSGSEEDDKDEMSDIESEDEPQTPIRSSDDDGDIDKSAHSGQIRGRVFRENQCGKITLEVGMLFNDLEHFWARTIALEGSNENHKESYNKFWKYGNIVRIKNQGSVTMLKLHQPLPGGPQHFLRFFLSFEAQKYGYLAGCRPFIGIDGCYLKNRYGGMLLSAVGIDANCGIFPIVVCICEGETSESWGWFLEHLYRHLHIEGKRMPCFMSDHQKGVLQAVKLFWPDAGIRHCARHMYANFKAEWKGSLYKTLFYAAVKTCDVHEFKATMQKIWNLDNEAYNYMMEYDPKHWSRHAFDPYICTDHVTNNITECWNGVINKFRRKIETLQEKARELSPIKAGFDMYEVKELLRNFCVKLNEQNCDCGEWQVSGIPCKHVMCCINTWGMNVMNFIDPRLKKEAFLRTYSHMIHPIPDEIAWPEVEGTTIMPPIKKRGLGRSKTARRRKPEESVAHKRVTSMRCRICHVLGHNKMTCTKNPEVINPRIRAKRGNSRNVVSKSSQSLTRTMSYEVGNSSNTVVGMSSQPVASVTQHESQEMEAHFSQQYVYGAGENTTTNAEDNPSHGRLDLNWDDLL